MVLTALVVKAREELCPVIGDVDLWGLSTAYDLLLALHPLLANIRDELDGELVIKGREHVPKELAVNLIWALGPASWQVLPEPRDLKRHGHRR